MGSLDLALTRQALAKGIVRQVSDDTPVAIRLFNVAGGTVTSITTTTATNIVMITANGGTDTYTFATYDTVGKLVAAINADGIFQAVAVDALLTDKTDEHFVDGAITVGADEDGRPCWDVLTDTDSDGSENGFTYFTSNLSPKGFNYATLPAGHRVHLQEVSYYMDLTAAAGGVEIWKRKNGVETRLYSALSVDTTLTTITFASGNGKITGGPDEEIIVRVKTASAVTTNTGNFLRAVGIYE